MGIEGFKIIPQLATDIPYFLETKDRTDSINIDKK
jgi:hypothetical protein